MYIYLRYFKLVFVAFSLLCFWQCQNQDTNPQGTDFQPDINVDFNSMETNRVFYGYKRGEEPEHNVPDKTIIPAVKNGRLSSYKSDTMKKRIKKDSFSRYTEGNSYHIHDAGIDWQIEASKKYAAPEVKWIRLGQSLIGQGARLPNKKELFYFNVDALGKVLNKKEKQKLNRQFYQKAIKEPFERERRREKMTAGKIPEQHTARSISWNMVNSPVQAYFNEHLEKANKKLNSQVEKGNINAYKTPSLKKLISDSLLKERCKGDKSSVAYRPHPRKHPGMVRDTVITERCKPEQIGTYMVLEQWQSYEGELYDFYPEVKALAPVVQPSGQKKVYYWVKWDEVKEIFSEEQTTWLKKYLLFGLAKDRL